jgi:sodium-dependent dicarboxylate transporter 2/3/5
VALVLGPLVFLALWFAPLPLDVPAHRLAAVMALVVVFWIGEPIPVAATALLGPSLALLLDAVPAVGPKAAVKLAYGGFGDPILLLFIGGFFIAEAMTVHGLDRRIAMTILSTRFFSASPARVVVGLGICSWLLSMWMSNTATTAILIPIAIGMISVERAGRAPGSFDTATMLMLPFASTVGGLATPVGTAPNLIGKAQMEKLAGYRFGFLPWMGYGIALGGVMMVALAWILTRGLKPATVDLQAHAREARGALGSMKRGERIAAAAFLLAVGGWVTSGIVQAFDMPRAAAWFELHLSEFAIPLFASTLLFLLPAAPGRPALTWREASRIDWGTLLLLGGGLSMGTLMLETGLAKAIAHAVVQRLDHPGVWTLTAASAALAILLSEITSNTATATMLLPVVIAIAQDANVSPIPPAFGTTLACSFGFMLPVSTPPNALAYGTGLVPIGTMARRGVVFDLVGYAIIVGGLRILCPVFGLA